MNRKEYRTAKFGSWERSLALDAQVAEAGRAEGIPFAFDRIMRTPEHPRRPPADRTRRHGGRAGRRGGGGLPGVLHRGPGHQPTGVLLDVVAEAGLDRERAETFLSSDEGLAAIRAAEEQARRAGVQGVPFFLINDAFALSGAREPSAFLAAFERATATSEDVESVCKIGPGGEPSC